MKLNKNSAFSLAESLISMMLLTFVVLLTMTSITRKKIKPISKTTISGMYACWEDGHLKEAIYDGNQRVKNEKVSKCQFTMDRRVTNYYVIAVGSRKCSSSVCVNGQVVEDVIVTPGGEDQSKMKLDIELGYSDSSSSKNNGGITTVKQGNSRSIEAIGGIIPTANKLVAGNIELCKFFDWSPCEANEFPYCTVSNSKKDNLKENIYKTDIQIQCKNKKGLKVSNCTIALDELTAEKNHYKGKCIDNETENQKTVKIKIQQKDASLIATNSEADYSQFVNFLRMLPQYRRNGLYDVRTRRA